MAAAEPSNHVLRYTGQHPGDLVQPTDLASSGTGRHAAAPAASRFSQAFPVLSTTDPERDDTPSTPPIMGSPQSGARRS